jgi:hypothetical protein
MSISLFKLSSSFEERPSRLIVLIATCSCVSYPVGIRPGIPQLLTARVYLMIALIDCRKAALAYMAHDYIWARRFILVGRAYARRSCAFRRERRRHAISQMARCGKNGLTEFVDGSS